MSPLAIGAPSTRLPALARLTVCDPAAPLTVTTSVFVADRSMSIVAKPASVVALPEPTLTAIWPLAFVVRSTPDAACMAEGTMNVSAPHTLGLNT